MNVGIILRINGVLTTGAAIAKRFKKKADEAREAILISNKKASIALYQWVLRNFQGEGELAGGWEPLAESTIAYKQAHGYSKILQNTGALRASFLPYSDDKIAAVGSPLHYSLYHEEGSASLPQRRMLPDEEATQEIALRIYGREMKIVTGRAL